MRKKRKENKRKEEGERELGQTEQTGKTHLYWGVTLPGTCDLTFIPDALYRLDTWYK
jgi:hypothetical protein